MRDEPAGKILEVVLPNHQPSTIDDLRRAGHPRITIRIDEVDATRHENVREIPAPRDEGEEAKRSQKEGPEEAFHGLPFIRLRQKGVHQYIVVAFSERPKILRKWAGNRPKNPL